MHSITLAYYVHNKIGFCGKESLPLNVIQSINMASEIYNLICLFYGFQEGFLCLCQFGVFPPGKPSIGDEPESAWVNTLSAMGQIDAIPVELYADASFLASIGL